MSLEKSILKTLLYFDIFDYPITKRELAKFLNYKCDEETIEKYLRHLVNEKRVWRLEEFYSLQSKPDLIGRRRSGNKRAEDLLAIALKISKRLFQFPYVRGIGISGSVSKFFADENADIDYFVITHPNRLWLARTFMHIYRKIPFVKNRNKFYCMNYYVDESELQIKEKNIYTATELVTLMPVYGNGSIENFYSENQWVYSYFPNLSKQNNQSFRKKISDSVFKQILETLFNNKIGDWLDNYLFRLTFKRWKLKETLKKLNPKGERMGFEMTKHCCKPNPIFFHDSFLEKYNSRLSEIEKTLVNSNQSAKFL